MQLLFFARCTSTCVSYVLKTILRFFIFSDLSDVISKKRSLYGILDRFILFLWIMCHPAFFCKNFSKTHLQVLFQRDTSSESNCNRISQGHPRCRNCFSVPLLALHSIYMYWDLDFRKLHKKRDYTNITF
jgi:hypothetical protein